MPRLTAPLKRPWPWAIDVASITAIAAQQARILIDAWGVIRHTRFLER
jgi:hypothetical protein